MDKVQLTVESFQSSEQVNAITLSQNQDTFCFPLAKFNIEMIKIVQLIDYSRLY